MKDPRRDYMSTDTIIAMSAVIIALASLFISVWSTIETRKHNRLSVTPHLKIDYFHKPSEPIKVILSNNGIGTALINEFLVLLDGASLSNIEAAGLSEALPRAGLVGTFYAYTPSGSDALSVGEQVILLLFDTDVPQIEERKKIMACLSRITFKIHYESMYGDKFNLHTTAIGGEPEKAGLL